MDLLKTKKTALLVITILITIALSACSNPGRNSAQEETRQPGTMLFSDDFSANPNGWGTMDRSGGEIGFEYGGLVIKVALTDFMFWTVNGEDYTDTRIDVDAVLVDGPTDDNFGVICRYQDDDNYYGFLVSHDGYFGIFKLLAGEVIMASENGDLQYSEAVRQGGVVNHITAICQDKKLKLSVNEVVLAEIEDDSFSNGKVGLIAGAYANPGVKVLFDNLQVTQP